VTPRADEEIGSRGRDATSWGGRMSRRRFLFATSVAAIVAACTPSQGGSSAASGSAAAIANPESKTVRALIIARDFAIFDPMIAGPANTQFQMVQAMYDALVRFKPGKTTPDAIEPDLAEKWENSSDGLTWTFTLRKGVKFHNNFGEVTADDVKFTYDRQLDKTQGGSYSGDYTALKSVDVVDPLTVKFTLTSRDPYFLVKVANYHGGFIVSKKAVTQYGKDFRTNPIGTGPFQFKDYRPTDRVVMTYNKDYWRGTPKVGTIEWLFIVEPSAQLLALKSGQIDMGRLDRDQPMVDDLKAAGLDVSVTAPLLWNVHLNMVTEPRFKDLRVRQAFAYGSDRNAWAAFFGKDLAKAASTPYPENSYAGLAGADVPADLKYPYDPSKAKALLADAGFPNGFDFNIDVSESSVFPKMWQIAQEQWAKFGVRLKLKTVDQATYDGELRKALIPIIIDGGNRVPISDVFLGEWFAARAATSTPTGLKNSSQYGVAIPGIDSFVTAARAMNDEKAIIDQYKQAELKILKDVPVVPLIQLYTPIVKQKYVDVGYTLEDSLTYAYQMTEKLDIKK
jgi:peptide/nickel transport system substrate-binding protein